MKKKRVILWFRNDLRLHDNEALNDALNSSEEVYPIYVFDPRIFDSTTSYGFPKTGLKRIQFVLDAVKDLKERLRELGSDLIIRLGHPEEVLFDLAHQLGTSWVFCNRERTAEEVKVQDTLEKRLWTIGQEMRYSRGKMLFYTADLPFPVTHTPDSFNQFRKETDKLVNIREPLDAPEHMPPFSDQISCGAVPTIADLTTQNDSSESYQPILVGGESNGLERLKHIAEEVNTITHCHTSSLTGLSPYLSQGCLSPKLVYQCLYKASIEDNSRSSNEFFECVYEHLLWRDFLRLMAKKHGNHIFKPGGMADQPRDNWVEDVTVFNIWANGQTGFPLVDAGIKELLNTGLLSLGLRRAVASFLVDELNIHWLMGAEFFESNLIDYDPCSNYGNWNYIAKITNDHKDLRYISPSGLAMKLDPKADYIVKWCPALERIPKDFHHQPYLLSPEQQQSLDFTLGKDFPKACIPT